MDSRTPRTDKAIARRARLGAGRFSLPSELCADLRIWVGDGYRYRVALREADLYSLEVENELVDKGDAKITAVVGSGELAALYWVGPPSGDYNKDLAPAHVDNALALVDQLFALRGGGVGFESKWIDQLNNYSIQDIRTGLWIRYTAGACGKDVGWVQRLEAGNRGGRLTTGGAVNMEVAMMGKSDQ